MSSDSSAGAVSTHGASWRYFTNKQSSVGDDSDHETEGNNQDDIDDGEFNELAAETSSLASSECSSFVRHEQATITAIRVRPMRISEKKSGNRVIVDMTRNNDVLVTRIVNPTALPPASRTSSTESVNFPAQFTQEFWFDYSYWSFNRSPAYQKATQRTLYDALGVLALQTVLQGRNCSVFAYGQPGAGKTYTMMGSSCAKENGNESALERRGLIPRICQGLFGEVDERKRSGNVCTVLMSYVEIYDERVYDLLSHDTVKQPLKIREHPEDGAFVERAQRVDVTSCTQLLELMTRTSSVTPVQKSGHPTRSHTVLTISLMLGGEDPQKSKLCLVDLAGSERVDHSGTRGSRLREASSVNRSLATLANVVGALAKCKSDGSQPQKTFVPYRNSALTRLLKDCLGGRAKTIMIGVISPCSAHYEESIATLKCIERARSLQSTGRLQADTSGNTLLRFLQDADELKSHLCASNEGNIPPAVSYGEGPEHNDDCPGCESCDDADSTQTSLEAKAVEIANTKQCDDAELECKQTRLPIELSVHLMSQVEGSVSPQRSIGRKAGCPPLHTRVSTTEVRTADRVHDVVAAVVATDAICCSVVQDFMSSHHPESQEAAPTSLLEQLASSSEYNRSEFCFDNSGDGCDLEELASPEGQDDVTESDSLLSSISSKPCDEESSIQPKLSLCLDSIDMARRALGPGVYSLQSNKMMTNGSGVECELLRYLDKRFIAMEWSFENLMVASQVQPLSALFLSTIDLLETMVGEFCLQIIPTLCDQLPSASSACVAGRHQLETQLDHFGYRLRRQLLPGICDGPETTRTHVEAVLFLATDLLVMTERMKVVWNMSGHKKRERLLQTQALEAAAIQNRKLATKIADLEERNQEHRSELESAKRHLSIEKDTRRKAEAKLVQVQVQVNDLKLQLACAESRFKDQEEAGEENSQLANRTLMDTQAKNEDLSASLSRAKDDLLCAVEKYRHVDIERALQSEAVISLKQSLDKAQIQRELAQMLAEDAAIEYAALRDHVTIQVDKIDVLERHACQDKQRLLMLEEKLAASLQERDEHILLMSQTEEALASALSRENALQRQLAGSSARESEETNRVRVELHEATLELASLREELAELLDHSTLQSSTIETLTLEQTETLQRAQDLETERDELALTLDRRTRAHRILTHQSVETLSRFESQQEIEREECMAVHEALQRQANAFQKLQARQHSIKMDYYSTIQDLRAQVETLSARSRALHCELTAKAESLEVIRFVGNARDEQTKRNALKHEELIYGLTEQLRESRTDLKAIIRPWIHAETQCGVLRVCIDQLDCHLTETKEVCMMQLADAESSQLRDDHRHDLVAVNDHLNSLDAWFDEVISGNQEISETLSPHEATVPQIDTEDGERLSMLKTLTDLTNELLVVCESSSNPNNLPVEASERHGTNRETAGAKQDIKDSQAAHSVLRQNGEDQKMAGQKEKSEVIQLRKTVMKLKEALDARDEMLLFLDGKVRHLEHVTNF
ncbi:Kinesin motor domain [Phytophthora infestans]|uniref:Kinesin motor domain n=1 Tax=Phytophthora infestans TaxID=4787 RepID=A0A833T4E8_PHYIN|nr:Kinesin motor domain [Phytophthora infestans]KAF4140948.1 Kinesin motor domain [Phytophthora infestans]